MEKIGSPVLEFEIICSRCRGIGLDNKNRRGNCECL